MDPKFELVAAEYEARAERESREMRTIPSDQMMARRDEMLLPVGRETATLLQLLIRGAAAQNVVEIGTSYGYSTLYLAQAARDVGGRVTTIELAAVKSQYAREALSRAELAEHVDFRVGDALKVIGSVSAPIDIVLIDLWKDLYVPCLELIAPKLRVGAIVIGDNMLQPEMARPAALAYQKRVRELAFDSVLLNVGSGIEVSRKR
jgi:predicted O-methyltransferase YrrM